MRRAIVSAALCVVGVLVTGCGGGGGASFAPPTPVAVQVQRVFPNLSFASPVALLQAPGDNAHWYVVEQAGRIRVFDNDPSVATSSIFLDIRALIGPVASEFGLLGMAFDPDFATNGFVYLSYTRPTPLTSYVSRFTSTDGGLTANPASEVVLLTLLQDFTNHNGGSIAFGPGGFLFIGFGDGGSSNDPNDRAQDTTNLFGTILRIDVSALPYQIPPSNPFAGNPKCSTGFGGVNNCPEIYAWGLRNPWRFSFDRQNGDLWAGDVGQDNWEEVDQVILGRNYGWRDREGAHCNPALFPGGGCPTVGLTDPDTEYDHSVGESITGGYVYRGSAMTDLRGSYVYGDFISGRVFRFVAAAGTSEELANTTLNIVSFAEANDGELYLVDYAGGTLHQIVAVP